MRTSRALTDAGSRSAVREVTWWTGDGKILHIWSTNPLHPLHRLLTEWVGRQPLLTPATDPDTLTVGDVVVSDGRQALITGSQLRRSAEHRTASGAQGSGVLVYPVLFSDNGEASTMAFDPTVPTTRRVFDPSGIRFDVSTENGNDRTVIAFSAIGARLGSVTWWETKGEVAHIAPEHQRNPLHRLLFARAKQLCPTLRGPMPQMPVLDNPVERIVAREMFMSGLDTGPDILGAHYMTKGIVDGQWNLPSTTSAPCSRHGSTV